MTTKERLVTSTVF